jgi:hypothetical protein
MVVLIAIPALFTAVHCPLSRTFFLAPCSSDMALLAAGLRGYLKDRIAWSPRYQTCPIPISKIIYAKRNFVGVSRIYLLTMNEQKQLEVILRVFRERQEVARQEYH